MEDLNKSFLEIRGNIKYDLTGLVEERVVGNFNYHSGQIIEEINKP